MKKIFKIIQFCSCLQPFLIAPCCCLSSCSNTPISITEPQVKSSETKDVINGKKIETIAIVGAIFIKGINKTSDLFIEAKEVEGVKVLGQIRARLVQYYDTCYYIKLSFENINAPSRKYNIALSYFYKRKPLIENSIYEIDVKPSLMQRKVDAPVIKPSWNFTKNKVEYSLTTSEFILCHPKSVIWPDDFNVKILNFDSDLESAEFEYMSIINNNELELTFSFGTQNLLINTLYHLSIQIQYLDMFMQNYDITFYCERGGWDLESFVSPADRNITITIPAQGETNVTTIDNFIMSGFSTEINNVKICRLDTSEEIKNVEVNFIKSTSNNNIPLYSFNIRVNNRSPLLDSVPFYISIDDCEWIKFDSGYFLTIKV